MMTTVPGPWAEAAGSPVLLIVALLCDRHSQNHFTAGAKDQNFYGHVGIPPTHHPFICTPTAQNSKQLPTSELFLQRLHSRRQRLEIFQKLGHSCLPPIGKILCRKSPFRTCVSHHFCSAQKMTGLPSTWGLLPAWSCSRQGQSIPARWPGHMKGRKLLDLRGQALV